VHRATLKGGIEVAVKVQRTGLDDLFKNDLQNLKFAAKVCIDEFDVHLLTLDMRLHTNIPSMSHVPHESWHTRMCDTIDMHLQGMHPYTISYLLTFIHLQVLNIIDYRCI